MSTPERRRVWFGLEFYVLSGTAPGTAPHQMALRQTARLKARGKATRQELRKHIAKVQEFSSLCTVDSANYSFSNPFLSTLFRPGSRNYF
jgi:hypothetical protein